MKHVPVRERLGSWRKNILRSTVNVLFAALTRREVRGLENIPAHGPCLLVFNHLSNFDPPLLFSLIPRSDVTGLVAADYRKRPFHRLMVESAGGTWLKRGSGHRSALETALSLLEEGWIVGISPEGRRSPTGALVHAKPGPAWLASRVDVPVVPIGITNVENLGRALRRLRRITLTVRIGEPLQFPPPDSMNRKEHLQFCTDVMMCSIAALLPPEYHGVYRDHPYLTAMPEYSPQQRQVNRQFDLATVV